MTTMTLDLDLRPTRPARVGARSSAPVRLTRRGRALIVLAVLAVVGVLAVVLGPSTFAGSQAGDLPAVHTVTVQPGDTLWDIAVAAHPSGDVRGTIDDILRLNSLDSASDVQLGDKLAVPVY